MVTNHIKILFQRLLCDTGTIHNCAHSKRAKRTHHTTENQTTQNRTQHSGRIRVDKFVFILSNSFSLRIIVAVVIIIFFYILLLLWLSMSMSFFHRFFFLYMPTSTLSHSSFDGCVCDGDGSFFIFWWNWIKESMSIKQRMLSVLRVRKCHAG